MVGQKFGECGLLGRRRVTWFALGGMLYSVSVSLLKNPRKIVLTFFLCAHRDSVTRFSISGFFHQTIPHRALIQGLKPFRIWIRIRRENRLCNRLPRHDRDRRSCFSGLIETAEAFFTPRKPSRNEYWLSVPLKGYYSKNKYICKRYIRTAIRKRTCERGTLTTTKNRLQRSLPGRGRRFWRLQSRFSRRIRIHIRNGSSPWIFWWKKPEVENLVSLSL
jgi:hypothetical protein